MALNFAFEEEAELFLNCVKTTVANRNRRREGKRFGFFIGLLKRIYERRVGSIFKLRQSALRGYE